VGAAGAQRGRTGNGLYAHVHGDGLFAEHALSTSWGLSSYSLPVSSLPTQGCRRPSSVLHEGLQLLDDVELVHLGGKILDELHGQREGEAQLQEGGVLRESFLGVLIGYGGRDDADLWCRSSPRG
jgi:hypothetical protein